PRKLGEMARFEAQQQIPFPIADVNWDWALVDREYEPDEDREVGLFAIKKEIVYANLADLQLSGLEPHAITTGPLAIYNFVRWDMELPEDTATVVLDIGWDHTDLVIVDGPRYWIRNLTLNGHEITKAIATKLKVSFAEAEQQKRSAAESKENRKLYQATELVLKDFVAEIQRSIAFYKAQNKDRAITIGQVLLLGNGSKLPNVRPFLQKELGFPVETVKRLSNLALDTETDDEEVELLKEHLPSFAVAFGLGIQGCGEAVNDVNLLPEEIRQRQALEKKKIPVAVAVAVLWIVAVCSFMVANNALKRLKEVSGKADQTLTGLKEMETRIGEARAPVADLEKQVRALAAVTARRNLPIEVLNKLSGVLPKGNDKVALVTDAQKTNLRQKNQPQKIEAVKKELQAAQDAENDAKTWILELEMKPSEDGQSLHTTLLVARKYVKSATGSEDEEATKKALEAGVLADVKGAFPKAHFEGAPKKIYNLDKDLNLPPANTPGFQFNAPQPFCGLTISFDYPETATTVTAAAPSDEGPK
ncbi:MAG TPA: pilus assembly protein PilM, partial [Planctomycetota bacterium]|nr:pilus assembly protein PilM [Planctomycetota bacterium]